MESITANGRMRKRGLTLSQYIRRRNGVPAGARGSLRNMFHRSLAASTFAGFWRHWNPMLGYALRLFPWCRGAARTRLEARPFGQVLASSRHSQPHLCLGMLGHYSRHWSFHGVGLRTNNSFKPNLLHGSA